VKKVRRTTRIRTETSRLVFIPEPTGEFQAAPAGHEFCPACGQPIIAPAKDAAALPTVCAERHEESGRDGAFDLEKQEK
jgi:hypothetical protein